MTDVAAHLGSSAATGHRLLGMLVHRDPAEQLPDRRYAAGPVPRRDRPVLLAEHLGRTPAEVADAVAAAGSLVRGIERLRRPTGRSLVVFDPPELGPVDRALAESQLLDAERTPDRRRRMRRSAGGARRRGRVGLPR